MDATRPRLAECVSTIILPISRAYIIAPAYKELKSRAYIIAPAYKELKSRAYIIAPAYKELKYVCTACVFQAVHCL